MKKKIFDLKADGQPKHPRAAHGPPRGRHKRKRAHSSPSTAPMPVLRRVVVVVVVVEKWLSPCSPRRAFDVARCLLFDSRLWPCRFAFCSAFLPFVCCGPAPAVASPGAPRLRCRRGEAGIERGGDLTSLWLLPRCFFSGGAEAREAVAGASPPFAAAFVALWDGGGGGGDGGGGGWAALGVAGRCRSVA